MSKNQFISLIKMVEKAHIPFKITGGVESVSCNSFSGKRLLVCLIFAFGLENKLV